MKKKITMNEYFVGQKVRRQQEQEFKEGIFFSLKNHGTMTVLWTCFQALINMYSR